MIEVVFYAGTNPLAASFWVDGFSRLLRKGEIHRLRWAGPADNPFPGHDHTGIAFSVISEAAPRHAFICVNDRADKLPTDFIARASAFFKLNYARSAIAALPSPLQARVHPTSFWMPVRVSGAIASLEHGLAALFGGFGTLPTQGYRKIRYDFGRWKESRETHSVEELRRLRLEQSRERDLLYIPRYWSHDLEGTGVARLALIRLIRRVAERHPDLRIDAGFVKDPDFQPGLAPYAIEDAPRGRAYREALSRTRMSIVSAGVHGAFSWRIAEHLALGRLFFCEAFANETSVPLKHGETCLFFRSDLSDLEEQLEHHLTHPNESEAMGKRAAQYFQDVVRPDVQARRFLQILRSP